MNRTVPLVTAFVTALLLPVSALVAQAPVEGAGAADPVAGPAMGVPDLPGIPVGPATGDQMPVVAADFIAFSTASDLFEIQSSRLVLDRGATEPVRTAAEALVAAHSLAARIFPSVLEGAGLVMNTTPALTPELEMMMDKLAAAAPDALERLYVEQQITAHQNAIAAFSAYAASGDNETLRAYAQMMLPSLESHLAMMQGL